MLCWGVWQYIHEQSLPPNEVQTPEDVLPRQMEAMVDKKDGTSPLFLVVFQEVVLRPPSLACCGLLRP